jgi:hypothetical protein
LIKGSVDFDAVEEAGKIRRFVEILATWSGINVTSPIRIRPASRADTKLIGRIGGGVLSVLHVASISLHKVATVAGESCRHK